MVKVICSISCRTMEKFRDLLDQVRGITEFNETDEELYFQTNEVLTQNDQIQQNPAQEKPIQQQTIDHVDVIGKRKGQPRKSRKTKEYSKSIECFICLKNHMTSNCPYYNELQRILKEECDDVPGRRKCGLCKHFDHTIRTCPLRKMALNHQKEKESSKDD